MTKCNDVNYVNTASDHSNLSNKPNQYPKLNSLQINQIQSYDALCSEMDQYLKPPSDFPTFQHYKSYVRKQREQRLAEVLSRYTSEIETYLHASALNDVQENPTNLTNCYWQAIVKLNIHAYQIDEALGLNCYKDINDKSDSDDFDASRNPLWSMHRMGQSRTVLPDGTEVLIGGEFEDYYDPQFCIYNDVIVKYPDGRIEIYGYPKHIFPPTDFHTATLVDDEIWIIGSLGYLNDRQFSQTQVCKLNIHTFEITKVETVNSMGWVHDHQAVYRDGQIIVHRGKILFDTQNPPVKELNSWALNLKKLIWQKFTHRQWQGFYIERKDQGFLHLGSYEFLCLSQSDEEQYKEMLERFSKNLGTTPDLSIYKTLFIPPIEHTEILDVHYGEVAISIDGTKVHFRDEGKNLQVYIEGVLPEHILNTLKDNLKYKLEKLENTPCDVIDIT